MFEHILKLFTEEPEKLKKVGIKIILLFNALLISLKLYEIFVGKYVLLDLKNFQGLISFILTGKVLIAIFAFMCCYYTLQVVLSIIGSLMELLMKLIIGKFELDSKLIQNILKHLHVVEMASNKDEIPTKGKNFGNALKVTNVLNDNVTIDEIRAQITFRYKEPIVATALSYLFIFPSQLHNKYISILFLIICFSIYLFEYCIENFIDYVHKNAEGWQYGFEMIDISNTIKSVLEINKNEIQWELNSNVKRGFIIQYNNQKYNLLYYANPQKKIGINGLVYEINKLEERENNYIVVIKPELLIKLKEKKPIIKSNILFLEFEDNWDLKLRLQEHLKDLQNKIQ